MSSGLAEGEGGEGVNLDKFPSSSSVSQPERACEVPELGPH